MKTEDKIKLVLVILISIVLIIVIPTSIYCAVKDESPKELIQSTFETNADKIVAKWQDDTQTSAYEFKDDGTYKYYLSTISYTGDYRVDGDELTLSDPSSDSTQVYKIKVTNDELTMTVYKTSGLEVDKEDQTKAKFNKVSRIENKTLSEILDDAKADAE